MLTRLTAEVRLLLLAMTLQRQLNEFVDKLWVLDTTRRPQLGVHADGGETGQGVDLVEDDLRRLAFGCGSHQEIDAREACAVAGAEGGDGHGANLLLFSLRELRRDDAD